MLLSADIMLAVLAAINMHLIVPLRCNGIAYAVFTLSMHVLGSKTSIAFPVSCGDWPNAISIISPYGSAGNGASALVA